MAPDEIHHEREWEKTNTIHEIAPLYGCMQFETLFQNIDFNSYCILCFGHIVQLFPQLPTLVGI